eukprot:TRINITY_DN2113_c0_g1_i1.p1 TRINITY_DN2113_c0_g1~~TRINITY_DN2113_c0_g1_i1.p1  ORF type:complete len:186 (+),score=5.23 TRINITY_DN2113_c0_g1_i1:348-905(+)
MSIPLYLAVYGFFKAKISLQKRTKRKQLFLSVYNLLCLITAWTALFVLALQSLLNQADNEPYHTISGLTYLGIMGTYIGLTLILFYITRLSERDTFMILFRLSYCFVILILAIITAIDAKHRKGATGFFSSHYLAVFELVLSIITIGYSATIGYEFWNSWWSFSVSLPIEYYTIAQVLTQAAHEP